MAVYFRDGYVQFVSGDVAFHEDCCGSWLCNDCAPASGDSGTGYACTGATWVEVEFTVTNCGTASTGCIGSAEARVNGESFVLTRGNKGCIFQLIIDPGECEVAVAYWSVGSFAYFRQGGGSDPTYPHDVFSGSSGTLCWGGTAVGDNVCTIPGWVSEGKPGGTAEMVGWGG